MQTVKCRLPHTRARISERRDLRAGGCGIGAFKGPLVLRCALPSCHWRCQPAQGLKVFTAQTLPACDEPFDEGAGKSAGFSLHAEVAA